MRERYCSKAFVLPRRSAHTSGIYLSTDRASNGFLLIRKCSNSVQSSSNRCATSSRFTSIRRCLATVLAKLNEPSEVVFLSAKEETAGDTYFDFADTLSIQYLIGEVDSDAEMQARMKAFMYGTTDLFQRFTIASQRLLAAAFFELGVRALP